MRRDNLLTSASSEVRFGGDYNAGLRRCALLYQPKQMPVRDALQ